MWVYMVFFFNNKMSIKKVRSDVQGKLCYFKIIIVIYEFMVRIFGLIPRLLLKLRYLSREDFLLSWNPNNNNASLRGKLLMK